MCGDALEDVGGHFGRSVGTLWKVCGQRGQDKEQVHCLWSLAQGWTQALLAGLFLCSQ